MKKKCNIAIFDAEFTAVSDKYRGIQEMIQCALYVHEASLSDNGTLIISKHPICELKKYVKPMYTRELTEYIMDLTGISQEMVDNGDPFKSTMDDIFNIIKLHDVKKIFTWGPDKYTIKANCTMTGYDKKKAETISDLIFDVSVIVSGMFGYDTAISQHKVCEILNVKEVGEMHDAKSDAKNLCNLIREIIDRDNRKDKIFLRLLF